MKKKKFEFIKKEYKEICCFILLENDPFYNGLSLIDKIDENNKITIKINDHQNYTIDYNNQELYIIN